MRRRVLPHLAKKLDADINPIIAGQDTLELCSMNGGMDKAEVSLYAYWRFRILFATMFGYATFYLIRLNYSAVIPTLQLEFGHSYYELGMTTSIFCAVYAFGKLINGYICDRSNPRYIMTIGLVGSAIVNLFMGYGESLTFLYVCWAINGWFQSMGWPPVARLLTHWFSSPELATKWAIWNCSQPIGGAITFLASTYLISYFGWQSAFFFPAILSLGVSVLLFNRLRDIPQSLGLPPVEVYKNLVHKDDANEEDHMGTKEILLRVFTNKIVWFVSLANLFLYVVRLGAFTWAPTFMQKMKGSSLIESGYQTAGFEIAGLCGGLLAGWLSDVVFKGRRGPVSCIYMAVLTLALFCFWKAPGGYMWLDTILLFGVGFLIYGPQVLVGVAAAEFASKKAAGTATGLTGAFGYAGGIFGAAGIGKIADIWGWSGGFMFFIASALLGLFFFALTWTQRAKVLEKSA